MKRLILATLLSLGLAMPAHAFVASTVAAILSSGATIPVMAGTAGAVFLADGLANENDNNLLVSLLLDGDQIDFEEHMTLLNVYKDIDSLVQEGLYTAAEGEALTADFAAFQKRNVDFSIYKKEIKGMTSEEVSALIQEKMGTSELLTDYFANKLGL